MPSLPTSTALAAAWGATVMLLSGCGGPLASAPSAGPATTPGAAVVSALPQGPAGAHPGGRVWRNSLGMTFVRIPAGRFIMGNELPLAEMRQRFPQYEAGRFDDVADEYPAHPVRLSRDFYIGQHEVTVGQFEEFVRRSGYVPESVADGTGGYGYNPAYDRSQSARREVFDGRNPRYSWRNPGFAQTLAHPVVNVTWNDAQALAAWLSRTEGWRYRLPTEAEWEYACRAGSRTQYPTGDDPATLQPFANVFDLDGVTAWNQWRDDAFQFHDGHVFTAPVGAKLPNAWGVYDMIGNVWEWTADWYGADAYAHAAAQDPLGPAHGDVKVRRGGSWHTWPLYSRCSQRNWNTPATRYTLVGIRLVLVP